MRSNDEFKSQSRDFWQQKCAFYLQLDDNNDCEKLQISKVRSFAKWKCREHYLKELVKWETSFRKFMNLIALSWVPKNTQVVGNVRICLSQILCSVECSVLKCSLIQHKEQRQGFRWTSEMMHALSLNSCLSKRAYTRNGSFYDEVRLIGWNQT